MFRPQEYRPLSVGRHWSLDNRFIVGLRNILRTVQFLSNLPLDVHFHVPIKSSLGLLGGAASVFAVESISRIIEQEAEEEDRLDWSTGHGDE